MILYCNNLVTLVIKENLQGICLHRTLNKNSSALILMAKDTKSNIISSALTLYLKGGLEAVSMRKVADHAGLSTMAAYRHFKNKDDLLNHVVMEGFRRFQDYFTRAKVIPDPIASLKALYDTVRRFC